MAGKNAMKGVRGLKQELKAAKSEQEAKEIVGRFVELVPGPSEKTKRQFHRICEKKLTN